MWPHHRLCQTGLSTRLLHHNHIQELHMKKLILTSAALLSFAICGQGQTSGSSNSTSNSAGATTDTQSAPSTPPVSDTQSTSQGEISKNGSAQHDKSTSNNKKANIEGCISQSGSRYMLMSKKYPEGIELQSSQDLSAHVGHQVKIKGTWSDNTSSSSSSNMGSGSSMGSSSSSSNNSSMSSS